MEILIIKLGALGDVVRTTSILRPLHEKFDNLKVTWVTAKSALDLLNTNPNIATLYTLDNQEQIKEQSYDWVICLDDEEEACELAAAVETKKLTGAYSRDGKRTYTEDIAPWFDMGLLSKFGKEQADKMKAENTKAYQEILFSMLELSNHINYPPEIMLTQEDKDFAHQFKEQHQLEGKEVIAFNTGSGGRWKDKRLTEEQTAHLIKKIVNENRAIILFGGPEEEERNKKILELVSVPIVNAGCKNTLRQFFSLVGLCDVLVTSDSLALHMGVAMNRKVLAFFYPTSAAEIELYGKGTKIVAKGESACSYQKESVHPPEWNLEEFTEKIEDLLNAN